MEWLKHRTYQKPSIRHLSPEDRFAEFGLSGFLSRFFHFGWAGWPLSRSAEWQVDAD